MPTLCSFAIHDPALSPLPPGAGLIYAAVTPQSRQYRYGACSRIVELNATNQPRPIDRLFTGKQGVLVRLGSRGVESFDYVNLLTIAQPDLQAAGVQITDVENVMQRLFVLAAGGLPLGNVSTRRDLYIRLPIATAVCLAFGPQIQAALAHFCNDFFIARLRIAMNVMGRWGDGPCSRNLPPAAVISGRRHFVPVAPQGGGAPRPQPTGLVIEMTPKPNLDESNRLLATMFRDTDSGPPCRLPSQGVNTDSLTPEEAREISNLSVLF